MNENEIVQIIEKKISKLRDCITTLKENNQIVDEKFFPLCAGMDILGDSLLVIKEYFHNEAPSEAGNTYLILFGIAQCLRYQLQFVKKSYELKNKVYTYGSAFQESERFSNTILDIIPNSKNECTHIIRNNLSIEECQLNITQLNPEKQEIEKNINYKQIVINHLNELSSSIDGLIPLYK